MHSLYLFFLLIARLIWICHTVKQILQRQNKHSVGTLWGQKQCAHCGGNGCGRYGLVHVASAPHSLVLMRIEQALQMATWQHKQPFTIRFYRSSFTCFFYFFLFKYTNRHKLFASIETDLDFRYSCYYLDMFYIILVNMKERTVAYFPCLFLLIGSYRQQCAMDDRTYRWSSPSTMTQTIYFLMPVTSGWHCCLRTIVLSFTSMIRT